MFKFMLTILAEMKRELTVERIRDGLVKTKLYGTNRPVLKKCHLYGLNIFAS